MQLGELFAEQFCIAARAQFEIFQDEKTVRICETVCDVLRYADGVRRGDCVQSLDLGGKHRVMPCFVELEEIARIVGSLQAISLVDAAATDWSCGAQREGASHQDGGGDVGEKSAHELYMEHVNPAKAGMTKYGRAMPPT